MRGFRAGAAGLVALGHLVALGLAPVWALPATLITAAYLGLLLLAAGWGLCGGRVPGRLLLALWAGAGPLLVIAAYTPSGWPLWGRVLLLLALALLTPRRPAYPQALTVWLSLALTIAVTYGADRALGALTGGRQPGGLVFPRHSSVSYRTVEFEHTVHINGHGFRGPPVDLAQRPACRVMLLGDSFTYGWGVGYPQTWGAVLENRLQADNIDAQVLNLGLPGGGTGDYAAIAAVAAPLLQPDVVLVGVLQGDDMRQVSREPGVFPRSLTFGEAQRPTPLREAITFHYPYIAERTLLRRLNAADINATWAATAAGMIAAYTPAERERYAQVPAEVRAWFERGDINPHFVHLAVRAPDYWQWPLQTPATLRPYIEMMTGHLQAVDAAAPAAETLVLSVPHGAYTQPGLHASLQRLGFALPPATLTTRAVDDVIGVAATEAGLPFVLATDTFRAAGTPAFYPLDAHFNAFGNRLFAETIAPQVAAACP